MTRFLAAAALALVLPVAASATPMYLPDLTFPEPATQPDVSTQGCTATDVTPCQ